MLFRSAWNEVCDWYLELIKRRLNPGENPSPAALADQRIARQVLAKVLNELLVMLHPLMPHLTEELWHGLTGAMSETFLALTPWTAVVEEALDGELEAAFAELIEAIRVVRNLRAVAGLKPAQAAPVRFLTGRPELAALLQQATADIMALTRAATVDVWTPEQAAVAGPGGGERALAEIGRAHV